MDQLSFDRRFIQHTVGHDPKYFPNARTGAGAVQIDPVTVAKRWLLIPLTRAVHLLVVHVRDPHSPVASMQREVASTPPKVAVALDPASNGAVQCSRRPRDQDWGGEEIKNASLKRSDVVDDVFAYEKSSGTCQRLTAF